MCGLLAFVAAPAGAAGPEGADAASAIARASHLMRHRGPDESGTWHAVDGASGGVVFGFNRLSIIDIAHSHQPLRWGPPEAPDRYVLVFNGEIYNYLELRDELRTQHGAVFATDGDGEAILAGYHHWGTEVLQRLRGMFAFALWDTVTRELFCARDPFGIKPLFIATGAGGTAVASEEMPAGPRRVGGVRHRDRPSGVAALHRPAVRAGTRDTAPWGTSAGIRLLRPDPCRPARAGDHPLFRAAICGQSDHQRQRPGPL